jgi:putative transposase
VNSYSLIALEKLLSQQMAKNNYGKYINDASWNKFVKMLCYKAESAGSRVIFVEPANTSKICNNCGNIIENLTLWDRVYKCPRCRILIDRDLNSAVNILMRATEGHSGSNASGNATIVASMKEEAHAYS